MLERTLSPAVVVLVLLATSCSTFQTRDYAPGQIPPTEPDERIAAVTRTSGERVAFDREFEGRTASRARIDEESIVGPVDGQVVRVSLSETSSVSIEEKSVAVGRTMLAVVGIGAATLFAIGAGAMASGW